MRRSAGLASVAPLACGLVLSLAACSDEREPMSVSDDAPAPRSTEAVQRRMDQAMTTLLDVVAATDPSAPRETDDRGGFEYCADGDRGEWQNYRPTSWRFVSPRPAQDSAGLENRIAEAAAGLGFDRKERLRPADTERFLVVTDPEGDEVRVFVHPDSVQLSGLSSCFPPTADTGGSA